MENTKEDTNPEAYTAFKRLLEIRETYPELTFNNIGYQYLKPEVREKYKTEIKEVLSLMKIIFPQTDFVEFNNFKPQKDDGSFLVRCQTKWSESFTGVDYFNITNP